MLRLFIRLCKWIIIKFESDGEKNEENFSDYEEEDERELQFESDSTEGSVEDR